VSFRFLLQLPRKKERRRGKGRGKGEMGRRGVSTNAPLRANSSPFPSAFRIPFLAPSFPRKEKGGRKERGGGKGKRKQKGEPEEQVEFV